LIRGSRELPNGPKTTASDIASAASFIRRLDLNLRAPDAINIAIADRIGAALATFDDRMAAAARALEVAVAAVYTGRPTD
jgi:uncharacterized protein